VGALVADEVPDDEVPEAVPGVLAATVAWLGLAADRTGSALDTHLALEVGCGAAVRPDAVARA
jgi:hypothetical protein